MWWDKACVGQTDFGREVSGVAGRSYSGVCELNRSWSRSVVARDDAMVYGARRCYGRRREEMGGGGLKGFTLEWTVGLDALRRHHTTTEHE